MATKVGREFESNNYKIQNNIEELTSIGDNKNNKKKIEDGVNTNLELLSRLTKHLEQISRNMDQKTCQIYQT